MTAAKKKRIGLVGARGHVGGELLKLLDNHPLLEVAFVASKGAAGQQLAGNTLVDLAPADLAKQHVDAVVLGLSNGQSGPWVEGAAEDVVVVDLSADHRFPPHTGGKWVYGLVEMNRAAIRRSRRIANPGCYSTAAQLAMWPFHDIIERAHVFGVSGYSGAGSTPSPKNDTALLADNLLPYDLIGHTQEKELQAHSGRAVSFFPHVASFFRGITCTISLDLREAISAEQATARLVERYTNERLVHVVGEAPLVKDVRDKHWVAIGGVRAEGKRLVLVAVVDNLNKGAATQALQNVQLALGLDELAGIPTS